jgi:hypothetical protein
MQAGDGGRHDWSLMGRFGAPLQVRGDGQGIPVHGRWKGKEVGDVAGGPDG